MRPLSSPTRLVFSTALHVGSDLPARVNIGLYKSNIVHQERIIGLRNCPLRSEDSLSSLSFMSSETCMGFENLHGPSAQIKVS